MNLIFNPKRWRQWRAVLKEEGSVLSWWEYTTLVGRMLLVVVEGLFLKDRKRKWHAKTKICVRCIVFDPVMKRCGRGPPTEERWGCGCYAIWKSLFDDGPCWGKKHLPKEWNVGWDFSKNPAVTRR